MKLEIDNAFVTGSRAYGIPKDTSDLDLAILVDQKVSDTLFQFGKTETGTCRFGMLNLVVFTDEERFLGWKDITDKLIRQKPVSRDKAKSEFEKAGLSGIYGEDE